MTVDEIVGNLSDVVLAMPPEVWGKVEGLVLILKTVGIVALVYFVYLAVMGFLNFKRMRQIKGIEEKIIIMDKKLDKLLKKKK